MKNISIHLRKFSPNRGSKLAIFLVLSLIGIPLFAQKTWIGIGAGGTGTDFNTASNWSPSGVPTASDDVSIAITASGNSTINLSANAAVKNLTFTISGNNRTAYLYVGSYTLTVNGISSIDQLSGNTATGLRIGVNGGTAAGVIDFGGNVTIGSTNTGTSCAFIGNANSKIIFRGNLTLGTKASVITGASRPGTFVFDGTGTQNITWNNVNYYCDANNVIIGSTNNPIVNQLNGTSTPDAIIGSLTLNGSSVLNLGSSTWNGGTGGGVTGSTTGPLTLNGTSKLQLGAASGGQTGSNFPLNFLSYSINASSTVEYNSASAQTVFDIPSPGYGNLTLTNASIKTAGSSLDVRGTLLINTGATFSGGTSLSHTVGGNFQNNGTFTPGTSTIAMNGATTQYINGSTATTFNNLTIDGSDVQLGTTASPALTTVSDALAINAAKKLTIPANQQLTASAGTITNNAGTAGLLLQSGASGSGSLISTSAIDASIERYVTRTNAAPVPADWHLLSSPVSNQAISDFVTNNSALATSGSICAIATYNTAGHTYGSYYPSNSAATLAAGTGYEMLRTSSGAFTFKGTINTGSISQAVVSSGDAWNLVGNPYTTNINTNALANASNNFLTVNDALLATGFKYIYVWNAASDTYKPIDNSAADYTTLGQGFFIKAASDGNLSFTPAMRTHTTSTFYKNGIQAVPSLTLHATFSNHSDWTKLNIVEGASLGMDDGMDALAFDAYTEPRAVGSMISGYDKPFAIQSIAYADLASLDMPLYLNAPAGETITFSADAANLDPNVHLYLEDREKLLYTCLTDGATYTTTLSQALQGAGRFYLSTFMTNTGLHEGNGLAFSMVALPGENKIRLTGQFEKTTYVTITDLQGRVLATTTAVAGTEILMGFENQAAGVYIVRIANQREAGSKKFVWVR